MPFIDLFSQTLLFTTYLVVFGLLTYGASRIRSARKRSHHAHRILVLIFSIAIICGVATWLIVQGILSQDIVPAGGILWVAPFYIALGLIIFGLRDKITLSVGILATLSSLVLLGLIVNNYYHYYPTLAAVFQTDTVSTAAQTPLSSSNDLPKKSVVLEQYYQPLPDQPSHGQLLALNIPSSTVTFSPRQGRIYLPPALINNPQIRLPVIVLLAGHPGSPLHWEQAGILAIMDTFAAQHKGLAPIVAVVDFSGAKDPDTECVDSSIGSSETYLTKDVPAYLKQHFQVQSDPSAWAIGGYSAGGTCGPLITLRNPTVYQNFLNISGDDAPSLGNPAKTLSVLFAGSQQQLNAHTPNLILKKSNPLYSKINGWYFYGRQDGAAMIQRIQTQYLLAKNAGLNVVIHSMDGHHEFTVWKEGYVEGLPWISNQMQLTTYEKK